MSTTLEQTSTVAQGLRTMADILEAPQKTKKRIVQVQGTYFKRDDETHEVIGACAFGYMDIHMFDMEHVRSGKNPADAVMDHLNIPRHLMILDPDDGALGYFDSTVLRLNDARGWTFKQIAAWFRREADKMEQEAKEKAEEK